LTSKGEDFSVFAPTVLALLENGAEIERRLGLERDE
jgi:hypothetical protein